MGFDVSFIGISKDIMNAPPNCYGFPCKHVSYPRGILTWLKQIIQFVDHQTIIKEHPDYVVLYNFPAIASLRIIWLCHRIGAKVIGDITEWEMARGFSPRVIIKRLDTWLRMHFCIPKMDGVIAISRFLYNYYKAKTACVYIPPTVDLQDSKWDRDRDLNTYDIVRLVYAGTGKGLGNKDRLDVVIDSICGVKGIELLVVGLSRAQYQEDYGKDVPEDANVRFIGRVAHEEAIKLVQTSDFQVLIRESNLKNNAGFPTKFVESICCCTPVIATATSNICDYLKDGENGFVVSEEIALHDLMNKIASLPKADIIRMKESCREIDSFDYRNYKTVLSDLFN